MSALLICGQLTPAAVAAPLDADCNTPSPTRDRVLAELKPISDRITDIELFSVLVNSERRYSWGVFPSRRHLFIRFSAAGKSGWSEMNIWADKPGDTLEKRTTCVRWFQEFKGKTPVEAIEFLGGQLPKLKADHHSEKEIEAAEIAILDLAGRLLNKPTTEILGLTGRRPVNGLFCILTDEPDKVSSEAHRALDQNLRTHLKVKLYGKLAVDREVVKAARAVMGPGAWINGDVNCGYRHEFSDKPVDDIVAAMIELRDAGLSSCEDPANMSHAQWAEVQQRVGSLSLLPDEPMRPARQSRLTLDPAIGRIFNVHPACMGSLIETVELGRAIQQHGKKLMVGDDSFVGPCCPAWVQIAIGLGADWTEALEKPQENDLFQRCCVSQPVQRTPEGRFTVPDPKPGFGVEINLEKLRKLSDGHLSL